MNQESFNYWLERILHTENPGTDIIAYYFGLFESEDGYIIYLTGSKEYDEENPDWASNDDFVPKDRYFSLGQKGANWQDVLEQSKTLIGDFMNSPTFTNSFLNKVRIATGFDDGDLFVLQ